MTRSPRSAAALLAAADAIAYLRHPRATSRRAIDQRSLAAAAAVTLVAIALTAIPPTLVPAPRTPPQIPRMWSIGLTWLGDHRLAFALLAFSAMLAASAIGYALTCVLVAVLRPRGTEVRWRRLLVGLGWINTLSTLSALIALPGVALQIARLPGYIPVDIVLVPPSVLVGIWVGVPACWTLREAAALGLRRAVLAFTLPLAVIAALGVVAVVVGFHIAWGDA